MAKITATPTAPVKKSAAAFSTEFYAIRNSGSIDARNILMKRAKRNGADVEQIASAARLSVSTVRKIIAK